MSLSRPLQPSGNDRKRKANGNFANTFPLLALPPELKSKIFSFLGPKDRLKARVCKELDAIEAESKYYVEKLHIQTSQFVTEEGVPKEYPFDGIRRISRNASIGTLYIRFDDLFGGWQELEDELFSLMDNFKVDKLILDVEDSDMAEALINNALLDNMPSSCKTLIIRSEDISVEALHEVYEAMKDDTLSLRMFHTPVSRDLSSFLDLIGITVEDDNLHSTEDIEVYRINPEEYGAWFIFDGNLEVSFNDDDFDFFNDIKFTLHETRESVEEAKGQLVDYKVDLIRGPE